MATVWFNLVVMHETPRTRLVQLQNIIECGTLLDDEERAIIRFLQLWGNTISAALLQAPYRITYLILVLQGLGIINLLAASCLLT